MKNLFLLIFTAVLAFSCNNDSASTGADSATDALAPSATTTITPPDPNIQAPPAPGQVDIPAGPDGIVHHYICEKMDGGFGDAAGLCPVCSANMAHNTAFHAQANAPSDQPKVTLQGADGNPLPGGATISTSPPTNGQTINATPPPAEPAQNAKGVWHYTCTKGCAGGAGSAVACGKCGTTLVHNTTYHQ